MNLDFVLLRFQTCTAVARSPQHIGSDQCPIQCYNHRPPMDTCSPKIVVPTPKPKFAWHIMSKLY